MKLLLSLLLLFSFCVTAQPLLPGKRLLIPSDVYQLKFISNPQVSPDGKWIAYTLSNVDTAKDRRNSDVWMISWDGKENIQLTFTEESESGHQWSPDGKYLSFISARNAEKNAQLWLLNMHGGEAKKLTSLKSDLEEYAWSPDAKKILLTLRDQDFTDTAKTKTRTPYVMDRYHFKEDIGGWIENLYTHLYLYDIASKKMDTLTRGNFDESSPAFSPDGKQIAFSSNRTAEPDKNSNTDIWLIDVKPKASLKQLTTWPGADRSPKWSPDGKTIAYSSSSSDLNFTMYGQNTVSLVTPSTGVVRSLSFIADRAISDLAWSVDGSHLNCLVADDRKQYIGKINIAAGTLSVIAGEEKAFVKIAINPVTDGLAALMTAPQLPMELYTVTNGGVTQLTHVQDSFLSKIQLSKAEGFTSVSKDGTNISGILYRPASMPAGKKLPLILFIHGGPVSQDDYGFDLSRQMLAAAGYAVAGINYRGSSGRGLAFTKSIYADWGNKEVMDILGAADYLVEKGIADEKNMGIGGWSYGGILTNYTIASDTRFKAAASGAGSSLQFTLYGIDQYITQYDTELGAPWKNPQKWIDLSYPFFKADRIKTPTLFMASEKDFNVPTAGSEQMYQALRSLGIPAQLIIYPGQFHGITKPSYQVDRFVRYIQWFGKYLK